ncbi:Hypothetical predicted protein [Mytilus galloprovincialis]|uniref:Beta/gamma crystallin 'Greek key' domain-containing protein n=1 Tax=Mytilus galloprovincialis TaxID=29158 RepID=A0A8B6EGD4_MYTGA|nr:Hypothetical predicted protein [Mytilus galloprovincialis]
MTLYEKPNFKGRSKDFTDSCPHLLDVGFDKTIMDVSSVKSIRGVQPEYKGFIKVIDDGEDYKLVELPPKVIKFAPILEARAVCSLKLLRCSDFYEEPECTVYKDIFSGRALTFQDDVQNLEWYHFTDKMSSIVVKSGAWVGYTKPDYEGYQTLFLKGSYTFSEKPYDEGGFGNDQMSSFSKIVMKPAGKMKLKSIDYDLNKNQILKTPSNVFHWTQVNNTSVEQTLTKTDELTIQKEDTYEFRWDKTSKISGTINVNVDIPFGGSAGISVTKEQSVNIGSSGGTKTSKTETWIAEYPSKIPPYSTYV